MFLGFTKSKRIGVEICSTLKRGGLKYVSLLGFTKRKMIGLKFALLQRKDEWSCGRPYVAWTLLS